MSLLQKTLDKYPQEVYNILSRDGERSIDLSHFPRMFTPYHEGHNKEREERTRATLELWYNKVTDAYTANPDLFSTPPVFSGGFFRDIVHGRWPDDLDLFVNSHGLTKEEAEDNLCLFMTAIGEKFVENVNPEYEGQQGAFRVFDIYDVPNTVCPLQVVLKDMGPPEDNPLYVTKDFHYNHGKYALQAGQPLVYAHSEAVAGFRAKVHIYRGDKAKAKCDEKFWGFKGYKWIDLDNPATSSADPLLLKKEATKKRNKEVAKFVPDNRRLMFALRQL
jgi:hypothetical protein